MYKGESQTVPCTDVSACCPRSWKSGRLPCLGFIMIRYTEMHCSSLETEAVVGSLICNKAFGQGYFLFPLRKSGEIGMLDVMTAWKYLLLGYLKMCMHRSEPTGEDKSPTDSKQNSSRWAGGMDCGILSGWTLCHQESRQLFPEPGATQLTKWETICSFSCGVSLCEAET